MVEKRVFFGILSLQTVSYYLGDKPDGTYLIRFSNRVPGTLTISRVHDRKIVHSQWGDETFEQIVKDCNLLLPLAGGISIFKSIDSGYKEM